MKIRKKKRSKRWGMSKEEVNKKRGERIVWSIELMIKSGIKKIEKRRSEKLMKSLL